MSITLKGKVKTKEHCEHISQSKLGQHSSPKTEFKRGQVSKFKGKHHSEEWKKEKSESLKGTVTWMKGKKHSEESKKKSSDAHKGKNLKDPKDLITPILQRVRSLTEYSIWRTAVFNRDNFTCQHCNARGVYLEAHHIKYLYKIIKENNITSLEEARLCEELWSLDNGVTYCRECHGKFPKKIKDKI